MATTLGSDQKFIEDLGSDEVRLLRSEFNVLLDFVLSVVNASATDGDTFQTNVAALDMSDIRKLIATYERPPAPKFPTF